MIRIRGSVNSRVNVITCCPIIGAANKKLQLRIMCGFVDDFDELVERGFVNDRADKVFKVLGSANFEGFGFMNQKGFHVGPEGRGNVGAGSGAAFLALIFEGAADGVDGGVVDVGALMHEVEILASCFAHDARVRFIGSLRNVGPNLAVQALENGGTARVMQARELRVRQRYVCDGFGVAWYELNDVWWEPGLEEDLVDEVVGCDGARGGFPDHDVTHESWGTRQITADGGEVEGADGVHEAF